MGWNLRFTIAFEDLDGTDGRVISMKSPPATNYATLKSINT